jgi:hypothetical protein
MTNLRTLTAMALFLTASSVAFAGPEDDELVVWKLEETYWTYVKNQDLHAYRSLWDERFVGWPSFSPRPMEKDHIADWIAPLHADPSRAFDYELKREAVRAFGDVVVAHYLYREVYRSSKTGEVVEESAWRRIMHTWMRRGDTFQIVTGMSASYDF